MNIGGGGGGGHLIVGLGRLFRSRSSPRVPGDLSTFKVRSIENGFIKLFYEDIRTHIVRKMNLVAGRLAQTHDWPTIEECTRGLLGDEITIGRLAAKEGNELIDTIRALGIATEPYIVKTRNYQALTLALSNWYLFSAFRLARLPQPGTMA